MRFLHSRFAKGNQESWVASVYVLEYSYCTVVATAYFSIAIKINVNKFTRACSVLFSRDFIYCYKEKRKPYYCSCYLLLEYFFHFPFQNCQLLFYNACLFWYFGAILQETYPIQYLKKEKKFNLLTINLVIKRSNTIYKNDV